MAINFPSIQTPSYPFASKFEDISLQSKMEDGSVVSRAKFTRVRETFTLRWNAMPDADYSLLRSFIKDTIKGGSLKFVWTYPVITDDPYSGTAFTVRLVGGDVEFSKPTVGVRSGQIVIVEV